MNISLSWLQNHITLLEKDPARIAEVLTEKSAEIEAIHEMGADLQNVVVGKIKTITAHPNADALRICMVDIGEEHPIQIVCGGSNLAEGQSVAVAKLGASVKWHGEGDPIVMKKTAIRGVESDGMICASDEIGCADIFPKSAEKEIVDLTSVAFPAGTPLAEVVGKNDVVLEIENTAITNRPDLFSHIGFARELAACGLAEWKNDICRDALQCVSTENSLPISISFPTNAKEMVPEYLAVSISGVNGTKQSPLEMQRLLKSVGIQPRNALVDITNFVMFDIGMPLHAFDVHRVGKKWQFELTQGGEKMTNLDGDEKTLPANAIILRDETGEIFDCCGIQGGKSSGIEDTTTEILLHAPVYDPVKIRRTAIAIDHRTDAATIYEKGVALPLAEKGIISAINWILEIFPEAKITSEIFHKTFGDAAAKHISVPQKTITRLLGHPLSNTEIVDILSKLGIIAEANDEKQTFEIPVPEWRTDLNIAEDIAEEVARMYGLNAIEAVAPEIAIMEYRTVPIRAVEKKVAEVFVANGFTEILSFSFLGEKLLARCGLEKDEEKMIFLKNPLSEELAIMRTSLSPRLLEIAERNRRYRENFRIFESGNIFKMENGEKVEEQRITALLVGDNFYSAKAVAEEIFSAFGIPSRIESHEFALPFAHPGRSAVLKAGKDAVIKIFQIHPKTAKEFHLPENTCEVCLTLSPLTAFLGKAKKIKGLPRFPGVEYDISVLCNARLATENLVKNFEKVDSLIVSARVNDIWEGKGVEEGKKSVTVAFEFRALDKTLEEKEIKSLEKKVLEELEKRGGVFRFGE